MRRSHSRFGAVLLASTALSSGGSFAQSLPTGGRAVSGSVTISPTSGNTLNIRQSSQGAIVNWQGFSIGQGNTVNIHQPGSSSALLNRVIGSTPSTIAGQLNAIGQVYLVNPNGVAITKTGVVRAAGFVASTLGVSDSEFLSGGARLKFKGGGASKAVTNDGVISVGRGGYAALIGGVVSNSGKILAPMGKVGLGSGETATLDFSGNGFLKVAAPTRSNGKEALVSNSGTIKADGGLVVIEAATAREAARNAVNISGLVQARSIGGHSGAIVIGGGAGGAVNVSGRLNVSGGQKYAGGPIAESTFDGQSHTISNLTIQRPTDALNAAIWTGYNVGLFGYVGGAGVVKNVTLAGGGVSGYQRVGALVGKNHGLVQNSSASVSVIGDSYVGGLVGWSYGSIIDSSASGTVKGARDVGRLAGGSNYIVEHSYATGGINSPGDYASNVGGLVGANVGAIRRSYATGNVAGNCSLGGLVGENYTGSSIKQSYATGNVSGVGNVVRNVGGLAGGNGGSISKSYATGAVSGANPDGDMEVPVPLL
ncbi:GLUG motif-containing protein [Methylocapsa palsarum]|uniref:Filamentous hemagglutinin family N-terminal domain-containing protein n=1 Tax=Methylocapsa palsarum TaxID=1612308 RepID=A0A1I3WQG7_9HYPH|nr:GLUG motif-containing protein [Methylocapsa palsarum]SFK09419.1 filamentous hemagglutinin family N-terminal domain-containing protein [Methylocapsa palsarum]